MNKENLRVTFMHMLHDIGYDFQMISDKNLSLEELEQEFLDNIDEDDLTAKINIIDTFDQCAKRIPQSSKYYKAVKKHYINKFGVSIKDHKELINDLFMIDLYQTRMIWVMLTTNVLGQIGKKIASDYINQPISLKKIQEKYFSECELNEKDAKERVLTVMHLVMEDERLPQDKRDLVADIKAKYEKKYDTYLVDIISE